MKQIAGLLRLELAQYREQAAFAQFGSDLDKATQLQLARGARLTELLKQQQYQPLPVENQIVAIYAGTNEYLDDLEIEDIGAFEAGLNEFMAASKADILSAIREKGVLEEKDEQKLKEALDEYKDRFKEELEARSGETSEN
jgi:F-type H+-transporting ATPase subunit alpha